MIRLGTIRFDSYSGFYQGGYNKHMNKRWMNYLII